MRPKRCVFATAWKGWIRIGWMPEPGARHFTVICRPGDYRFRVAACNRDGVWDENESGLALTVLRYFWQTWWFITMAALSLLVLVGGAVRIVEKRNFNAG